MPISQAHPKLRSVEVIPVEEDEQRLFVVHDPTGLATSAATVGPATMFILMLMDGKHSLEAIQQKFNQQFGKELPRHQLVDMIEQLDEAHFLDSEEFTAYFQSKVDAYRAAPARVSTDDLASLGAQDDGLVLTIERMLAAHSRNSTRSIDRRLAGLIVPHLDFARGKSCYADGYKSLSLTKPADRYVILGTNHFGRGTSVVATLKDFQTPLGTTRTDRTLLAELQSRLDADLCEHEFDHQSEHSIELQVLILQYLLADTDYEIVPVLCPDPCGPSGTEPIDGQGVDLAVFAKTLGEIIHANDKSTIIIAGADLSHVGMRFGDQRELDDAFLGEVEKRDREILEIIITGDGDAFVQTIIKDENRTRFCSAGCIYALMAALPRARRELINYHQAVHQSSQTCVTCCAMAFWET